MREMASHHRFNAGSSTDKNIVDKAKQWRRDTANWC
jgi:hypothetical protein